MREHVNCMLLSRERVKQLALQVGKSLLTQLSYVWKILINSLLVRTKYVQY